MGAGFHLAQINIAKLAAPLESPRIADFRDNLERINALAEAQPGFIWRAVGEGFDATDCRVFDDPEILINVTVWESAEHLAAFVFRTEHREFVRRRLEWFEPASEAFLALWWVRAGHIPDFDEAIARLNHLRAHGPTPEAFGFRSRFPAPDAAVAEAAE
jgi:heme-degrading monooxygenase HmoA